MNKLITAGEWTLRAEINRILVAPDHFHLAFTTQQADSRHPDERRTAYSQTLSREQMAKLSALIDLSLLETTHAQETD